MSTREIVDLSSDDEGGNVGPETVKWDSDFVRCAMEQNETHKGVGKHQRSHSHSTRQDYEENTSSSAPSTCHSYSGVLEPDLFPVDDAGLSYPSPICAAPLCRMFWKAGNYDNGLGSDVRVQNVENYLHVQPTFLHSNATSHRWVFGAIAELLDNAVDEIQNGATFVVVDKTSNPKDGRPTLLIQDDGGGMDPEAMRRCLSFGFSDKKSKFAVGKYGNGFKAGSMRLGADVIVFSRHLNNEIMTQSIGLLSYTFLMRTQLDRIVVPMVSYEFNTSTGSFELLNGREHFMSNLFTLLHWSPYSSEKELLEQFKDIGPHGTKIIIYNLWSNDDGNLELDFDTDPENIRIAVDIKMVDTIPAWKTVNEQHIANQFHYSLRVYLSILYLQLPESFKIILRGKVVKLHNIADDLKYTQYILYRPQSGGSEEAAVVTTIGFLKEAPEVNVHGFSVYHKNRLILPFWQVVRIRNSTGRGVVGVLQADFLEPTHDKQGFGRTSLFEKLGVRLKEMALEYWRYHCHLIGYQEMKPRAPVSRLDSSVQNSLGIEKPVALNKSSSPALIPNTQSRSEQALLAKRKTCGFIDLAKLKRQATEENVTGFGCNQNIQIQTIASSADRGLVDQEAINLMQVNKKLHAEYLEFEKAEEELKLKVTQLRSKIEEAQLEYNRLLAEVQSLDMTQHEEDVVETEEA